MPRKVIHRLRALIHTGDKPVDVVLGSERAPSVTTGAECPGRYFHRIEAMKPTMISPKPTAMFQPCSADTGYVMFDR